MTYLPVSEIRLIFIHGFNSCGGSDKATFLREQLTDIEVISPDLPPIPNAAIALLSKSIEHALREGKRVMLVGSSLGGFYSAFLGVRHTLPFVMINPLVDQTLLRHEIGPQQNYYSGEQYDWTEEECDQLDAMIVEPASLPVKPLLLLDEADELLDSQLAAMHFNGYADVQIFPGGNHRFAHMPEALQLIRGYLTRAAVQSAP